MVIFNLNTITQFEGRLAVLCARIVMCLGGAAMRTGFKNYVSGRRYVGRISNISRDLIADLVESQGDADRYRDSNLTAGGSGNGSRARIRLDLCGVMRVHQQVLGGNGRCVDEGLDVRSNVVLRAHTGSTECYPYFARRGNGHRCGDHNRVDRLVADGIQGDRACYVDRRVLDISLNRGCIFEIVPQN